MIIYSIIDKAKDYNTLIGFMLMFSTYDLK